VILDSLVCGNSLCGDWGKEQSYCIPCRL